MLYTKKLKKYLVISFLSVIAIAVNVHAQWVTQTVQLRPGWNAVFVQVQPEANGCTTVFKDIPVEEVWAWNRKFTTAQFITSAEELLPEREDWLVYFPGHRLEKDRSNLYTINGARAYLVKINGNDTIDWHIEGISTIREPDWLNGSYNLIGFHLDAGKPISFKDYFSPSAAHTDLSAFRMNSAGEWLEITDTDNEKINENEAYWIYSQEPSTYSGPISVEFEQGNEMNFGRVMMEQQLRIHNHSAIEKTVTLTPKSSEAPSADSKIGLAGDVPLSYFAMDLSNDIYEWRVFTQPLTVTIASGKTSILRVAVRRPNMVEYQLPDGIDEAYYQSLLEVTDGDGILLNIPVVSEGMRPFVRASGSNTESRHTYTGLWAGSAVITAVSETSNDSDRITATPTASEFAFRLILHVNADGEAKLLKQALLMHKDGTYKPNSNDPDVDIVDQEGKFVLLSKYDPQLIDELGLSGAAIRGNTPVARRVSSAAFVHEEPAALGRLGSDPQSGTTLSTTLTLDYNHPLNPFKHRYHPDHNNIDERYEGDLDEGEESYTINREIDLTFSGDDPMGLALAGWGDNQLGGTYEETITGVHRDAIYVSGFFRLHKVSPVAVLDAVAEATN